MSSRLIARRAVAMAADAAYAQAGMHKADYRRAFENYAQSMSKFPALMERYFHVAAAMPARGYVPVVHAQASPYRGARIFVETLCKSFDPNTFFRYLRQPSNQFTLNSDEIMKRVDAHVEEHGDHAYTVCEFPGPVSRLDQAPAVSNHLLSSSYSMMDFGHMESACHFLFENRNASGDDAMENRCFDVMKSVMQTRGLEEHFPNVWKQMVPLLKAYEDAPIGSLYVIGIPKERVENFAYDSKSFGIPTGESVADVVKNLSKHPRAHCDEQGGPQARLMVHRDTLNPRSGIAIVDVSKPQEVKRFCKGIRIEDPKDIEVFAPIFRGGSTGEEERFERMQQRLDKRVMELAGQLRGNTRKPCI